MNSTEIESFVVSLLFATSGSCTQTQAFQNLCNANDFPFASALSEALKYCYPVANYEEICPATKVTWYHHICGFHECYRQLRPPAKKPRMKRKLSSTRIFEP